MASVHRQQQPTPAGPPRAGSGPRAPPAVPRLTAAWQGPWSSCSDKTHKVLGAGPTWDSLHMKANRAAAAGAPSGRGARPVPVSPDVPFPRPHSDAPCSAPALHLSAGEGCPHCPVQGQPSLSSLTAHLTADPRPSSVPETTVNLRQQESGEWASGKAPRSPLFH